MLSFKIEEFYIHYWQNKVSKAKCTVVEEVKESKTKVQSVWMQGEPKPVYPAKATLKIKINGFNATVDTEISIDLLKN
ncbi:hypothetical protein ABCY62_10885 [Acetivibrio clariflavus]|uniref:hypothetical protein n=1 Tax=Acetivibrio clariflavus TaxID=288965 RepID=UPI0031F4E4AD